MSNSRKEGLTQEHLLQFKISIPILFSLLCAYFVCVCVKLLQSCPSLCDPMDCSPPGSSVHGILQARILEWVAISPSGGSSRLRDWTHISRLQHGMWILYHCTSWEALLYFRCGIISFPPCSWGHSNLNSYLSDFFKACVIAAVIVILICPFPRFLCSLHSYHC